MAPSWWTMPLITANSSSFADKEGEQAISAWRWDHPAPHTKGAGTSSRNQLQPSTTARSVWHAVQKRTELMHSAAAHKYTWILQDFSPSAQGSVPTSLTMWWNLSPKFAFAKAPFLPTLKKKKKLTFFSLPVLVQKSMKTITSTFQGILLGFARKI